jgi:folate-dependent phosphoribosylglycinamide formyltransferase PurN
MKILDEKRINLILLIGYMRFISKPFVDKWKNKVMNVHPSLLPKFAGGMDKNVHQAVLDAKETETGMTIHFVDEGADSGPIILQKKCKIEKSDTADTLKEKVQRLEGEGFIEAIKLFSEGRLKVDGNKVTILKIV